MKKFLYSSAVALSCFCISCNNNSAGLSPTAQKNLDAMRGVTKCFDTKDFSKLGDFIAADAVDHAGQSGDIKGLENMKAEFTKMVATYDNGKTEVIKELADDEYVMTWQRYTGTMKSDEPSMAMKAGDKIDMTAIELAKFKDGKAIEHWTFMSPAEMMKMMPQPPAGGAMPATPPADTTKKDTTKKM
ncbi:MAG: ester cyclase [Ferruginibacter sp.]